MTYKPRNQNPRVGDAPLSWSQRFYDSRQPKEERHPCGFRIPDDGTKR